MCLKKCYIFHFFVVPLHCFSAGEGALLNPESNATMDKSKLKWVLYTGEMFDVYVTPNLIKRLLAPIEPDLEYVTSMQCRCLHLRPSGVGLNKHGEIVSYLYSTNSGRFFDHGKDGWVEQKYQYTPGMQHHKGGSDYPQMCHFGCLDCHLLVAHAWISKRPEGMVCDHKDGNKLNFSADNFEWVTVPENNRRADIMKRMRKIALDPRLLTSRQLSDIYNLPTEDDWIGIFLALFLELCDNDASQMTIEAIRRNVAKALDALHRL